MPTPTKHPGDGPGHPPTPATPSAWSHWSGFRRGWARSARVRYRAGSGARATGCPGSRGEQAVIPAGADGSGSGRDRHAVCVRRGTRCRTDCAAGWLRTMVAQRAGVTAARQEDAGTGRPGGRTVGGWQRTRSRRSQGRPGGGSARGRIRLTSADAEYVGVDRWRAISKKAGSAYERASQKDGLGPDR